MKLNMDLFHSQKKRKTDHDGSPDTDEDDVESSLPHDVEMTDVREQEKADRVLEETARKLADRLGKLTKHSTKGEACKALGLDHKYLAAPHRLAGGWREAYEELAWFDGQPEREQVYECTFCTLHRLVTQYLD